MTVVHDFADETMCLQVELPELVPQPEYGVPAGRWRIGQELRAQLDLPVDDNSADEGMQVGRWRIDQELRAQLDLPADDNSVGDCMQIAAPENAFPIAQPGWWDMR